MQIAEIEIPVPWGHVNAKTWGDKKNEVVLCVHGIQDNAATFDKLIPLLPHSFYYICIDLPGHGKSSHFSGHLLLYNIDYIVVFKIVLNYINRNPITILSHSYGAQIAFYFTILYPHYVKRLILWDSVHFKPVPVEEFKDYMMEKIDTAIKIQEKLAKCKPPIYTYEEALNRLIDARAYGKLTKNTAKMLLTRNLNDIGDGKYKFSLDQRLKNFTSPMHDVKYILEILKKNPITCPTLVIMATETMDIAGFFITVINELEKYKNCLITYLEGNHNIHSDHPNQIAPLISNFLTKQNSKL